MNKLFLDLDLMIRDAELFTKEHMAHGHADKAIREASCLAAMFPAMLDDIGDSDAYAGRIKPMLAGYRYSYGKGDIGFWYNDALVDKLLQSDDLQDTQRNALQRLDDYWKSHSTYARQLKADGPKPPENIRNALHLIDSPNDWTEEVFVANYMSRMCEIDLDFDKLLKLGVPGLRAEIAGHLSEAAASGRDISFYVGMSAALDVIANSCLHYASMAEKKMIPAQGRRRSELQEMARILRKLPDQKPDSLREAIQLYWLYGAMAFLDNYGRMDVYLGDFYAADIDSGRLSAEEANVLVQDLWRIIADVLPTSGRVVIGGVGRRNAANADRFAMAALLASKAVRGNSPQLSLRNHTGMDPEIFETALGVIGSGSTYPILYNDDVHVKALTKAFDASEADAEQYVMNNCGEYCLEHRSINSPNGAIGYYKILELTLFNGIDPLSGKPMGLQTGGLESFRSFNELMDAFRRHAAFFIHFIADHMKILLDVTAEDSPNLFCSLLFDNCLSAGKGLLRGAPYVGLDIETHGIISVANSLFSIRKLVYEEKKISAESLLQILKADFTGFEAERHMMQNVPKFGNDNEEADLFALELFGFVNSTTKEAGKRLGMDVCLASHVSVNANVYLGMSSIASPDGRFRGQPITNSINPLPGEDKNGITALLNSMAKFQPNPAAGVVMNLKVGKEMFTLHRDRMKALLKTYFNNGGSYLCIAVMDRGDLERAMERPEDYANLMVRVGGFSARFVTLARESQLEILERTMY